MNDRAIAMALRIEKEFEDIRLRVKRAVQLAYGRVPSLKEWDRLQKYLEKMTAYHEDKKPEPVEYPTSITRSLWLRRTLETHLSMKRFFRSSKTINTTKRLIKLDRIPVHCSEKSLPSPL